MSPAGDGATATLKPVDVAVVGAGIGGCYVAYRLLQGTHGTGHRWRSGTPTVALFESSPRIGGRLWSVRAPLAPGTSLELGGMRFHRGEHHVVTLIRHLGLRGDVLPFWFSRPENIVYARGARLRVSQLRGTRAAAGLPFRLSGRERGLDADGLQHAAIEAAVPGFTELRRLYHRAHDARDWPTLNGIRGRLATMLDAPAKGGYRLRDVPWSAVLDTSLSPDAVRFVRATDGYDGYSTNGNAADWIAGVFQVPANVVYQTLGTGMQSLPRTVHARFSAAGGRTFLGHELRRVDRTLTQDGPSGFELRFRVGTSGAARREEVHIRAGTVVLALPREAIAALDRDTFFLTPAVRADIDAVQRVPAFKLFLVYPFPWWRRLGIRAGRSTTDLPLRQVWYFADRSSGAGLTMAAYPAGSPAGSWSDFCSGPRFGDSPASADETRPSAAMVSRAHSLLSEMHGIDDLPYPVTAFWRDWSAAPGRAAWHVWRPGYVSHEVGSRLTRPVASADLYIVSDCWTGNPGSVQGTLSAAESVLRTHLGCTATL